MTTWMNKLENATIIDNTPVEKLKPLWDYHWYWRGLKDTMRVVLKNKEWLGSVHCGKWFNSAMEIRSFGKIYIPTTWKQLISTAESYRTWKTILKKTGLLLTITCFIPWVFFWQLIVCGIHMGYFIQHLLNTRSDNMLSSPLSALEIWMPQLTPSVKPEEICLKGQVVMAYSAFSSRGCERPQS